jgi:hypothetical protein
MLRQNNCALLQYNKFFFPPASFLSSQQAARARIFGKRRSTFFLPKKDKVLDDDGDGYYLA